MLTFLGKIKTITETWDLGHNNRHKLTKVDYSVLYFLSWIIIVANETISWGQTVNSGR